MDNLENGWLLCSDFDNALGEEDVMFYCEWCEKPIYTNSYYHNINGDRVCCKCYDNYHRKTMEEEMEEE